MADDLNISASELKASAGAADSLVTDLRPILKKAIDDTAAAAASLNAWPVKARLDATGTGWGDALTTLQGRLTEHAEGLRLLADHHSINDLDVGRCFTGW
ncbi:hypothetical protein [Streptomyces crystallinus]|uniref:WXG100 family type VII secretion target n=1 Tax=Streptomyces crystallinus TaxID=68191 RepID=A0ABN1GG74_9ACTN